MRYEIDGFDLTSIITKHGSGDGWLKVCDCSGEFPLEENIKHTKEIVKAVNNHEVLVNNLKMAHRWFDKLINDGDFTPLAINDPLKPLLQDVLDRITTTLKNASAEV